MDLLGKCRDNNNKINSNLSDICMHLLQKKPSSLILNKKKSMKVCVIENLLPILISKNSKASLANKSLRVWSTKKLLLYLFTNNLIKLKSNSRNRKKQLKLCLLRQKL